MAMTERAIERLMAENARLRAENSDFRDCLQSTEVEAQLVKVIDRLRAENADLYKQVAHK
jgi:regulator of replication initiation timing